MPPSHETLLLVAPILVLPRSEIEWAVRTLQEHLHRSPRQAQRDRQARYIERKRTVAADASLTVADVLLTPADAVVSPEPPSGTLVVSNRKLLGNKSKNLELEAARAGDQRSLLTPADASADAVVTFGDAPVTVPKSGLKGCVPGTTLSQGLWADILRCVDSVPVFRSNARLHNPRFWNAELDANPDVDYEREIAKAAAWIAANPARAPRKDFARFLHFWFARAQEQEATNG